MRYLPHTEAEIGEMLDVIGLSSLDDLFSSIPPQQRQQDPLALDPALDEGSLMRHVSELAAKNLSEAEATFEASAKQSAACTKVAEEQTAAESRWRLRKR